jgi:thioesterase domain-containing protein
LIQRLDEANREAFRVYRPAPYEGDATFFAGSRALGDEIPDPLPVWRRVVRGTLTVRPVPGRHDQLVDAERVAVLAREITRDLGAATARK